VAEKPIGCCGEAPLGNLGITLIRANLSRLSSNVVFNLSKASILAPQQHDDGHRF